MAMTKMKETIKKWLPSKRKLMQLYFALLFNANLKGFVSGKLYKGATKNMCVPGINCYSCPGAIGACPLGSLQGAFSSDNKSTLFYVGGILLLYSILFGRMICGWLCPFGLIQELLYKIKTPKLKKSPITRILSYFKYVLLAIFVLIIPISYACKDLPLPAFCKYICPAGTIEGGLGLLSNKINESYFSMLGPLFTWKFMLMISIVVGCVFAFRLFCRFLCPLGALYGLFNKISVFGVKLDAGKCTDCGLCQAHCKVDIRHVGDQECVSCGECIDVCPTKAISWKGSGIFLRKNEVTAEPKAAKKRRTISRAICAAVMLAVLVGAVAYYWNDTTGQITAEQGYEIGDLCYGYDLPVIDESGTTGETINPIKTGKITIINFWGTWCSPCKAELPYFHRIAEDYADQVAVVAVHTYMIAGTAPGYIAANYVDSPMIFAQDYPIDETGLYGGYYVALGGRDAYPYTVIIDENGIILANFVGSVTYDDLQKVIEQQLN